MRWKLPQKHKVGGHYLRIFVEVIDAMARSFLVLGKFFLVADVVSLSSSQCRSRTIVRQSQLQSVAFRRCASEIGASGSGSSDVLKSGSSREGAVKIGQRKGFETEMLMGLPLVKDRSDLPAEQR